MVLKGCEGMKDLNTLLKESNFKLSTFEKALNLKKTAFYRLRIGDRVLKYHEAVIISEMLQVPIIEVLESWRIIKTKDLRIGA